MEPQTAVRDAIQRHITATNAEELEQIEELCIDTIESVSQQDLEF
jgi:hypothetical protein